MKSLIIALAIILASIILVIGAHFVGQSIWIVLTAIGTIIAVIWAIFHQGILTHLRRPILEIMSFKQEPPYFRQADEYDRKTRKKMGVGYYINIPLKNRGKTIAKRGYLTIFMVLKAILLGILQNNFYLIGSRRHKIL